MTQATENARPDAAFVLSLVAGLLILAGSGLAMGMSGRPYYSYGGMMGGYAGMMNGYYGMMGGYAGGWFFGLAAIGLVSGIVLIVGAIAMYINTRSTATWGAVILIFSIASLLGMGGFFVGAALGVAGGALALTWKPK